MVPMELQKHPCDSITMDYYRDGELQTARLFIGDQGKESEYATRMLTSKAKFRSLGEEAPAEEEGGENNNG